MSSMHPDCGQPLPTARASREPRLFLVRAVCALTLLSVVVGCRARSTRYDSSRSVRTSAESLESLARVGSSPSDRAERYLDAAQQYLRDGRPDAALRCASAADRDRLSEKECTVLDQTLGEAYLRIDQLSLAQRYLRRAVPAVNIVERDRLYALLVVALSASGDHAEARAYRDRILDLDDPGVRAALAVKPVAPTPRTSSRIASRSRIESRRAPRPTTEAPRPSPPETESSAPLPSLTILPRSAWGAGALVSSKVLPMGRIQRITLHHSGPPKEFHGRTRSAAVGEIQKIQRHHQRENGWGDIGYHFVIDRLGEVWQGRPIQYQGAHASGSNEGNIGIVLLGNYDHGHQHLVQEQAHALTLLVAHLSDAYGVPPREVYTHQEITGPSHTRCPGPEITEFASRLRSALADRLVAMRSTTPVTRVSYRNN